MIKYILLLFILLFIVSKFSKFSSESLYNGKQWDNYRLGDVILMSPHDQRFYNSNYKDNILYHTTKYPDSIAAEYIRNNKKHQNFELLKEILKNRKNDNEILDNNTLVLHIRVGDVLCKKVWTDNAEQYYSKKGDLRWWNQVINYINKNNINSVIIIAGTHFKECLKESADYINDRTTFLQSNGLNVSHHLGKSPDDDLIFCQNAKHFITTGGGYGNLIKLIIDKNKSNNK